MENMDKMWKSLFRYIKKKQFLNTGYISHILHLDIKSTLNVLYKIFYHVLGGKFSTDLLSVHPLRYGEKFNVFF